MRRYLTLFGVVLVGVSALLLGATSASGTVIGTNVLYTVDADFDQGTLVNVNHDAPNNNQLQLNAQSGTFPFIWIALSQRCTIAKINTETGVILGEYRTISDGVSCNQSSRTTVGIDGSVWVGHRGPGGVNHVGLAELNQCIDRNSNGTIETSTAYGDVKPWPGSDSNVASAEDECILHHVNTHLDPLNMGDSRHMSIDANNKLWVGDFAGGGKFVRIDGTTGAVETAVRDHLCGGYGGLIDGNGVIWSAQGSLLRWNPDAPDDATNPRCISGTSVYGLAVDGSGSIWATQLSGGIVRKVSADGNTISVPFSHGSSNAQGLAVDSNGDVWVSSSLFCGASCTIGHLKNDGTFVGNVSTPTGAGSTGIAVDAAGKIWAANLNSNTATRIDPSLGPLGCGGTGCADGTTHVGEVDLTVSFPATAGRPLPFPYNYSDMTGAQLFNSTAPQGTWTVVQDGTAAGTEWGKITWNTEPQGSVPAGTTLTVEARAAETEAGLGSETYVAVANGADFSLTGRFIQARVTFKPNDAGASPVLSDLRIQATAPTATTSVSGDGRFNTGAGRVDVQLSDDTVSLVQARGAGKFTFNGDVDSIVGSGNSATMTGTGTYNGVAGYTFSITVVDNGAPGSRSDTIDVVIRDAAGAVVFTSDGPELLKPGNITVTNATPN